MIKMWLKNKRELVEMSVDEFARWASLIEAVNIIDKKAQQLKIDTDKSMSWIKPGALDRYIKERHASMVINILGAQQINKPMP